MDFPRTAALIAGGGIGGLAAAIALARRGFDVQVCERRPEFPEEGAGIQIGPNGSRILRELGVAEYLIDKVATPDSLIVHDGASGRELTRLPLGSWIAKRHGSPYWTAHRRDLHMALRARAQDDPRITLARATEIISATNTADEVSVSDSTGNAWNASLLIAADGLWSRLRPEISGSPAHLIPVGKTAFRTVMESRNLPAELQSNAVHIWLASGTHVVHYPVSGGRDIALVVIADNSSWSEGWDSPAAAKTVAEKIKSFAPSLQTLIARTDRWRQWSLYRMPKLSRWTSGRAALLGDAAHPMLPFLAQGAVMALEDAVTLAACAANANGNVERALHNYERLRRPRVEKVVEASLRNGQIYHMSGVARMARDITMKFMPPERVMDGYDWLYGWMLRS